MGLLLNVFVSTLSTEEPMSLGVENDKEERLALVPSLFPLMPPTLYFSTADEKGKHLTFELIDHL